MTTLEIKLNLPDEIFALLKQEAEERKVSFEVVVSESLKAYFDEPTDAEILESIKIGMQQALAGDYRPAHEVLEEIEQEMIVNGDDS